MSPPDFGNFSTALATAKRSARSQNTAGLTDLLELTAGVKATDTDGYTTVYRPFFTAALYIRQNPKHIIKATGRVGAEYVLPEVAIAALIEMQVSEDARLDLVVPAGYEAALVSASTAKSVFAGVAR